MGAQVFNYAQTPLCNNKNKIKKRKQLMLDFPATVWLQEVPAEDF
jgi:hypothetical protein